MKGHVDGSAWSSEAQCFQYKAICGDREFASAGMNAEEVWGVARQHIAELLMHATPSMAAARQSNLPHTSNSHFFTLWRFDFMMDEHRKLYVLEVLDL